jgi:hypothetical protein
MDIPLNNKRRKGAQKKTKSCLEYQPSDTVQVVANAIVEEDSETDEEIDVARPSKRTKVDTQCTQPVKICEKCHTQMKKKEVFIAQMVAAEKTINKI